MFKQKLLVRRPIAEKSLVDLPIGGQRRQPSIGDQVKADHKSSALSAGSAMHMHFTTRLKFPANRLQELFNLLRAGERTVGQRQIDDALAQALGMCPACGRQRLERNQRVHADLLQKPELLGGQRHARAGNPFIDAVEHIQRFGGSGGWGRAFRLHNQNTPKRNFGPPRLALFALVLHISAAAEQKKPGPGRRGSAVLCGKVRSLLKPAYGLRAAALGKVAPCDRQRFLQRRSAR